MKRINLLIQNYIKAQWLLFTIACLVYANTIQNKWAVDDGIIIHQNKFVQKGVKGIPDIVTNDAFAGFYNKEVNAVEGGRFRPLSQIFFALNAEFFAKESKAVTTEIDTPKVGAKDLSETTWFPNWLHFFNVLWYGLLCLLIYRTLVLLFTKNQKDESPKNYYIAFITTFLFAVHPLHTEVVANVKGLDEILALLGSIYTLYSILKLHYANNNQSKTKWGIIALISFGLALFSKESAITFIAIIPLALFVFTNASAKAIFKLSVPLLLPVLLFLGIRQAVLNPTEAKEIPKELLNDPFLVYNPSATYESFYPNADVKKLKSYDRNTLQKMPKSNELATNFYTYSVYLKLLIAPYPLTVDYYPRHIEVKSFASPLVLFSVVLHLFLLIWAIRNIRNRNWIAFGILYYFITFSIVSNFFFSIGANMAERFMFMPSFGFCFIVATLLIKWAEIGNQKKQNLGFSRIAFILGAITLLFCTLTIQRNFDWKDNITLFSKDVLVSSNSAKINFDLAALKLEESEKLIREKNKETANFSKVERDNAIAALDAARYSTSMEAIPLLEKAVTIHPLYTIAWLKLGNAYHYLGQLASNDKESNKIYLEKALAAYQVVKELKGKNTAPIASEFLGICLMDYGKLIGQQFGNLSLATIYLEQAKSLSPNEAEIYLLLGTVYALQNNFDEAIKNAKISIELQPNNEEYKRNLETILALKNK